MQNVLKVIVKMDKGLMHLPMETNMLENGKMIKLLNEKNFMDGNDLWGKVV